MQQKLGLRTNMVEILWDFTQRSTSGKGKFLFSSTLLYFFCCDLLLLNLQELYH
jgi:hypothetical protein